VEEENQNRKNKRLARSPQQVAEENQKRKNKRSARSSQQVAGEINTVATKDRP